MVPYRTMELCSEIFAPVMVMAEKGLNSALSDAGVAAMAATAGLKGAALNVRINLSNITDEKFVAKMGNSLDEYEEKADHCMREILAMVQQKLFAV